jgi:hypothetical protein
MFHFSDTFFQKELRSLKTAFIFAVPLRESGEKS